MKRLLLDATSKLRKMVDESKQLTGRLDADIDTTTDDALQAFDSTAKEEVVTATNACDEEGEPPQEDRTGDEIPYKPPSPIPGTLASSPGCEASATTRGKTKLSPDNPTTNLRLRMENERLSAEVAELRKLVNAASDSDSDPLRVRALELELKQAKEQLAACKADRKRLKAERFDLLAQMKQLYGTLEDKENELRDFIRNYEQRMRDSDASLEQLASEREERERERWSLLRHARDEAERSLALASQLEQREQQIQDLREQLQEARGQLGGCLSDQESLASVSISRVNGSTTPALLGHYSLGLDRGSCSADSGLRGSSDRESTGATSVGGNLSDSTQDGTPTITVEGDMDNVSMVSSIAAPHMYQSAGVTPKDCSPALSPMNALCKIDSGALSRSVEQLSSPLESDVRRPKASGIRPSGNSRGGTWGSISRVFARGRHRSKAVSMPQEGEAELYQTWSPLTEVGYAEKLRLLREASSIPMERWRAPTVLAWLEIALGMPQYGPRCAENVKSGKVLLELSDVELEVGLGIQHPMHRKKLRLAIEEHRHPQLVRYQAIAQLGHTWVSSEWLPDLGLAQYSENFATNMVDARMLDHLSKKELEKFLGVTRKFHQASIVHGIHLLRLVKYDRQALAVRRHQCENSDVDPLVWTNQRFVRWARNIDLAEYADNLKDSGVHGALVVLEPSFNGDTMATALGIPPSKNIIRRHLATELEALVLPARSCEDWAVYERRRAAQGSLGRSFSRSSVNENPDPPSRQQRSSLRGSLSRAFGFKVRQDSNASHVVSPSSSSESRSSQNASPTGSQSGGTLKRRPNHRRVKSIGDIDIITITPV